MKPIFLVLLFANLVAFACQFDVVRDLAGMKRMPVRPVQMNAERLRIVRDTSTRPRPTTDQASGTTGVADGPPQGFSGTNSR